jgi:Asp-tRNA(Asn)/Glu-tRNA(Gln) amidotransferase C subunit|tara:strand:+ start:271 stop:531 length:261 start_codon:yes stop_codon:yes gene_type:complete
MDDFLWHKVSENEKESIRKQAKEIMDKFSEKISKVDKKISELLIEREEFERTESDGKETNLDFRKRMFENAPKKNKDFILTEKKKW